jgi:hypothetical protein
MDGDRVGVLLRNSSGLAGGRNPIRVLKPFETLFAVALKEKSRERRLLTHWPSWNLHYLLEFDDNGYNQPAVRVSTRGR